MKTKFSLTIQMPDDAAPRRFSYNILADAIKLRDRTRAAGGQATEPEEKPTAWLLEQAGLIKGLGYAITVKAPAFAI